MNRLADVLGPSTSSRAPLATELAQDDAPSPDGKAPNDDAKKELGAKIRSALSGSDDAALYDAVCAVVRMENMGGGSGAGDVSDGY